MPCPSKPPAACAVEGSGQAVSGSCDWGQEQQEDKEDAYRVLDSEVDGLTRDILSSIPVLW